MINTCISNKFIQQEDFKPHLKQKTTFLLSFPYIEVIRGWIKRCFYFSAGACAASVRQSFALLLWIFPAHIFTNNWRFVIVFI